MTEPLAIARWDVLTDYEGREAVVGFGQNPYVGFPTAEAAIEAGKSLSWPPGKRWGVMSGTTGEIAFISEVDE